ncbi:MAG: CarD family transcriptional regulator [Gallintestinimicrobium sp.]
MFEKGDLVTYGCKGVCEVKNITTLNLEGIPKDRLYYEMQSMVNAGSRIFLPSDRRKKCDARGADKGRSRGAFGTAAGVQTVLGEG